jgi:hypothetical protein
MMIRALVVAAGILVAGIAQAQTGGSGIGYNSPQAALKALHDRPDVQFSLQNGWIIAADRANATLWSFAEKSNPAFPAAVKRQVVQTGDKFYIAMSIMCGGPQAACDQLPAEFQALNQNIRSSAN